MISSRFTAFPQSCAKIARGYNLVPQLETSHKRWDIRCSRLLELEERHKAYEVASPILGFYGRILKFQSSISSRSTRVIDPKLPLRAQIDVAEVASLMPTLFSLIAEHGTDLLREAAERWISSGDPMWRHSLESAMKSDPVPTAGPDDFFTRACLQPIAENLQLQLPGTPYSGGHLCPACAGLPQMAVLRPEGDAAGRWLLCSFCLREWAFRRLICPWCQEENKEKLPRYASADSASVHIEACDTCRHYLKAIDMTVDGLAVPLVDEAAFSVLDLWATDRGYKKIVPNLLGF